MSCNHLTRLNAQEQISTEFWGGGEALIRTCWSHAVERDHSKPHFMNALRASVDDSENDASGDCRDKRV